MVMVFAKLKRSVSKTNSSPIEGRASSLLLIKYHHPHSSLENKKEKTNPILLFIPSPISSLYYNKNNPFSALCFGDCKSASLFAALKAEDIFAAYYYYCYCYPLTSKTKTKHMLSHIPNSFLHHHPHTLSSFFPFFFNLFSS
ncbi:hypothetical protein RJT34_04912 [Clitoria ternatea]|uniref:Uncharacterized protein n=1 Tax=Clitoria ternatea TaxID=43366 RepID=A0AAN9Q330_CLITE